MQIILTEEEYKTLKENVPTKKQIVDKAKKVMLDFVEKAGESAICMKNDYPNIPFKETRGVQLMLDALNEFHKSIDNI